MENLHLTEPQAQWLFKDAKGISDYMRSTLVGLIRDGLESDTEGSGRGVTR